MVKSLREAKLHTTWAAPNLAYEEAMLGFVARRAGYVQAQCLSRGFLPFQERVARLGVRNSLVQAGLKLTLPGMPDIYQGAELWDLSLVDPDNRRPVDYGLRARLLEQASAALESDRSAGMLHMLEKWQDGSVKLAVTAALLAHRRQQPELYAHGSYQPLAATGAKADQLCAFMRSHGQNAAIIVASRFPARQEADPTWADTTIAWPQNPSETLLWRDLLSNRVIERQGETVDIGFVLGNFPLSVLVPADGKATSDAAAG